MHDDQAHVIYRLLTDHTVKKKKRREFKRELNECQNASVMYAQLLNHLKGLDNSHPPERLIWNSTPCPGIRRDPYSSLGRRNDTNVYVLGVSPSYGGWGWWQGGKKRADNICQALEQLSLSLSKIKLMHRLLFQMFSQSKRHFDWLTAHFTLPQSLLGFSHTLKRWKLQKLDTLDKQNNGWKRRDTISKAKVESDKSKGNRT